MAACPEHIDEYEKLVSSMREAVKLQSRTWDVHDRTVRDRLYRLLYGGRTALEEVMLQAPRDSRPAMMPGTNEPSQSPHSSMGEWSSIAEISFCHEGELPPQRLSPAAMITRGTFRTSACSMWTR